MYIHSVIKADVIITKIPLDIPLTETTVSSLWPTALEGISAMERFYHSIGMPTSIHELIGREISDVEIEEMVRKCSHGGTTTLGSFKVLHAADMELIYRMAK